MKIFTIALAGVVTIAMSGCSEETSTEMDEICNDSQAQVSTVNYLKGGGGGGGGARGGGGSSGGSKPSSSGAKNQPSNNAKPSSKPHGSYTKSNGYYTPYIASDGSEGYWDDQNNWVECEDDDDKKKAKRK